MSHRLIMQQLFIEFSTLRLIKVCLNETCSTVRIDEHFSDAFPIQNGVKQGDHLLTLICFRTGVSKLFEKRATLGNSALSMGQIK
jgi:hypothetical protein